ncbi:MAG: sialidase family protein [Bryobacteraceae bacterium]|nr:sialidase family protein [Bryobacteraceae bacterium]
MRASLIAALMFLPSALAAVAPPAQTELFESGTGGYHTYRIPALIATPKGTLLAFCEGRKNSRSDSGDIDLLVRRSTDGGRTWSAQTVVADFGEDTIGNPAPVVDRRTGTVWLLLTSNKGHEHLKEIVAGTAGGTRTVWVSRSSDDGIHWSAPVEITRDVKRPGWTWYATGPGNGIQLKSGRLVIACDHYAAGSEARHSHVIYSDDGGASWKIGGVAGINTNESAVAEISGGRLLLNMRSLHGKNRRAIAESRDGGLSWSDVKLDEALIEPVCQASLIQGGGKRLLFSNPASTKRERMTVKLSRDEGRTWNQGVVVHAGPAAYSSLAMIGKRTAGLLYERGEKTAYERITFATIRLALLEGK